MIPALLILAAYLIGAIPTSYIVGRMTRGIDLRQHGSGNLGATNTYRVLGWRAATPVFIVDIFKGFAPAWFFPAWDGRAEPEWALAYGAAAIVGHMFSVYVNFKGGKGVATSAGVFLALAPAAVGVALLIWLTILWLSGYVSLASIVAAAMLPILIYFFQAPTSTLALASALSLLVLYGHRANMRRLLKGEEHRFRRKTSAA